jgi:predicted outer membrane repeat protein
MRVRRSGPGVFTAAAVAIVACGGAGKGGATRGAGGAPHDGAAGDSAAVAVTPTAATCDAPLTAIDTSSGGTVVGTGTAASCTAQALSAAVAAGGIVTFDCGGAATIAVGSPITLSIIKDTVIDGGGQVVLDGGGTTRVLDFESPNYRATTTTVTLEHLTIAHGKATGTAIAQAPPPCSQGTGIDGGGAGIFVRDGILHVVDVTFDDNHAAALGPDVGGGAIYATGSLGVVVVGSRFTSNSGSNGGAIGSLNSDLTVVDATFAGNQATGEGENTIDSACAVNGGESGNGGNSGAIGIDGGSDGKVTICGCTFANNSAGALAGAIGRTADNATQTVAIDRSTFDGNTSVDGGGALYIHNCDLDITASTFSNNSAPGAGAIQADSTTIDFVNDTFSGNSALKGLGGALSLFSNGGTIQSCTFAENHSDGGSGLFAAAIAGGTTLTIEDTIFANNTTQDCGSPMTCQDGSSSGQANLQWPTVHDVCSGADSPCTTTGTQFADPQLGPLGDNGGPTQTMVPAAGSPAAGAGVMCPATDQRGNARKVSGCTVGAVELP